MKRIKHSVLLAGLLTLALTACTSDRMGAGDTAGTMSPGTATDPGYGISPTGTTTTGQDTDSTGGTAGTASTGAGTGDTGTTSGSMGTATTDPQSAGAQASTDMATTPNSVVTMIEVVPRADMATGAGTMAGAAVGGTAAGTSDRVYRVTLRMDDGSTRVVTQEWAPTFRSGDRVTLSGGEIQRP